MLFEVSVSIGMLDVGYSVRSGVNADLLLLEKNCLQVVEYRYLCDETGFWKIMGF